MDIQATPLESAVVLKLSGRMDAANATAFQESCNAWMTKGSTRLVVDVSELTYLSSMGLGCFLAVAKALQAKNGSLMLCQLRGLPRQVFQMTNLLELFPHYDSTEAALRSLS